MGEQITDDSDTAQRQLEAALGREHNPENRVSGGPIEYQLKEGWGKLCFTGKKAHYWIDVTDQHDPLIYKGERVRAHRSLCGVWGSSHSQHRPMLHPGTMDKCRRCSSIKAGRKA